MKDDEIGPSPGKNRLDSSSSPNRELESLKNRLRWAQESQELAVKILALLNRQLVGPDVIGQVLGMVKEFAGFEAVGIRLRDGEDFPYFETQGFPDHFVECERSLCERTDAGEIVRDSTGNPLLECMCGNVISGRTDPSLPFFTQGGSFWTNCTTELLATTSEEERQGRTRDRCNGEGYESVALIPLRSGREIIGLIQLNDSRKNCFTPDMISFLEAIGASIGIVLKRTRVEQERDRLFNLSIDMLCVAGFDGCFKQVNPAVTEILGWTTEEFLSKPWTDLVHPDDHEKTRAAGRRLLSGVPLYCYENRYLHKDGSYRWISWNCFPIRDERTTFAVARDVTGRKQSEHALRRAKDELESRVKERTVQLINTIDRLQKEVAAREQAQAALRQSEERYRTLVENVDVGITLIDSDHNIVVSNSIIGKWFNRLTSDFTGKKCFREFEKREDVCPHCPGVLAMSTGQAAEVETEGVRDDGTRMVVRVRAFPMFSQDNVPIGFTEIIEDVTEHKRLEEALRESEQRYRNLVEESRDGIFWVAWDGALIEANQGFLDLLGITSDDSKNWSFLQAYRDPVDHVRFKETIERNASVADYELKLKKKEGTEIDCLLTATLRLDEEGKSIGFQGIIRDVTERKRLEQQLLRAQKMEAIGTLAGGIAHDFNNLLTVILGYSELIISEKNEGDRGYEDLNKVIQAARTAADMVQQILAFSRKAETKVWPININKQIPQLRKMLSRLIPRTIDVRIDLAPDLPTVNADSAQIDQVLMNLAVNARDAMPDGGRLTIETRPVVLDEDYCSSHIEAAQGLHALLSVSDTGIGIDRGLLDRIFEPFYTTKKPGEGTGLGLAMVYGIVKAHGGHVTVYSEPGTGTVFNIYLPAHQIEAERDVAASGEYAALGFGTILLADDEEFVRSLGQRILEKCGYHVLLAKNGREAVEIYNQKKDEISLVILDLIMPEMDGKQCLHEILKIDPDAKVLLASGYSPDGETNLALESRVKGFVRKPYSVKHLLEAVRDVLKKK